ncbi:hypothetical protein OE88DRAFT_1656182 [Heliocybe sulcata]|uniref:Uncharacterized protein n=1 Tax=Heliocybe sulcata TaxID=5364 RepID=A0A5C3NBL0_9AGAM|nr:hypothetical protein OE88DRAFT_1656182 [Heliocybe sulcata]
MQLSGDNCPPAFIAFLSVWANTVPEIQNLAPEHQHDLARIICSLPPLAQPTNPNLSRIAADLRAVAIEISQRRSFQERYGGDLQAAIDAGEGPSAPTRKVRASFQPPPAYDPSPSPTTTSPHPSPRSDPGDLPQAPSYAHTHTRTTSTTSNGYLSPAASNTEFIDPKSPISRPPSPSILTPHSPAIELIRETLYASLADVLERQPSIRHLLAVDPPRAYFAAVSFAILEVATTCVTNDGDVLGVLGQTLTLAECPRQLKPFMIELASIGNAAREMEEQDDEDAMRLAARGEDIPPPRLERVRYMLEKGVGHHVRNEREREEGGGGRRSVEGRAVAFANRVNGLALGLTRLRAFRERQGEVFKVLSGEY